MVVDDHEGRDLDALGLLPNSPSVTLPSGRRPSRDDLQAHAVASGLWARTAHRRRSSMWSPAGWASARRSRERPARPAPPRGRSAWLLRSCSRRDRQGVHAKRKNRAVALVQRRFQQVERGRRGRPDTTTSPSRMFSRMVEPPCRARGSGGSSPVPLVCDQPRLAVLEEHQGADRSSCRIRAPTLAARRGVGLAHCARGFSSVG